MAERITDLTTTQADSSPHALMAMALHEKADPAILSRLMDLQERWDAQQARKAYVEAMAAFKRDVPSVLRKDAKVDFTSAKGRTHYKHATLGGIVNQVTTAMGRHGLSASWETKQDKGLVTVTCHVTHSQGHRESVTLAGPPDDSGNKNLIQQIGSSVTYLQRYTLLSALGLATSDQDDADQPARAPVAMPTAKPAATHTQPQEPEQQHVEVDNAVIGKIEAVKETTGKKKDGSGYTRYGITMQGRTYGTFDTAVGEEAKAIKEASVECRLIWQKRGDYFDAVRIEAANATQQDTGEVAPF